MNIYSATQLKEIDRYTIHKEPISSIDLMERASIAFSNQLQLDYSTTDEFHIFCGNGNNGGDGLAIARILGKRKKTIFVYLVNTGNKPTVEYTCNLEKLYETKSPLINIHIIELQPNTPLPIFPKHAIIIDALFGYGLNRKIEGFCADVISHINIHSPYTIAVDIPSGLSADIQLETNAIICAKHTYTFEFPKLQFLFAENEQYVGDFSILPIQLLSDSELADSSSFKFTIAQDIQLQNRKEFSHKGTYGHALIVAGSFGKMGAAVITSRACISSGCGLVSAHIPLHGNTIMQIAAPEIMTIPDASDLYISSTINSVTYNAIGIGPGLGTDQISKQAIINYITSNTNIPIIIDADALNCLANNKEILSQLQANCILTPHPKEFDRLTQPHTNSFSRLQTQIACAKEWNCIIVLKGHYTSICLPNGTTYFNSTGNQGMATAGSGDVLTGIITSLLAQQYTADEAALYGVYIHGLAGDFAAAEIGFEGITAQKIIDFLPLAFKELHKTKHFM